MPRRSSTRQSRSVVPSATGVAPALKTLLIGYGQSLLVRIGFAGWRRSNGSKRVLNQLTGFSGGTVREGFTFVRALAEIAFRGVPLRTIAWILPPDSHWRGRDAGRPGIRR